MDSLVIITKRFTKEYKITSKEITIGRSLDNTLCLNDETISRSHAKIVDRDGTYYIMDMNSYNGTIINGQAITPGREVALNDEDNVVLGDYKLICKFGNSADTGGGSEALDLDMDLDAIVGDGDDDMVPENIPGMDSRKTMRYKAVAEDRPTPEHVPFNSANPFAQASDTDIEDMKKLASRATVQHMPALTDDQLAGITAETDEPAAPPPPTETPAAPPSPETPEGGGDYTSEEVMSYQASLLIELNNQQRTYHLEKEVITLGRGKECDIVLNHFSVSKNHAEVRYEDGEFVVYDCHSTNGTMVNDSLVQRCVLMDDTAINFGNVNAVFSCHVFPKDVVHEEEDVNEDDITNFLVELKIINKVQANTAVQEAHEAGRSVKQILLSKSIINPIQWAEAKEALKLHGVIRPGGKKVLILGGVVLLGLTALIIYLLILGTRGNKVSEETLIYQKVMDTFTAGDYEKTLGEIERAQQKVESSDIKKKLKRLKFRSLYQQSKDLLKKGEQEKGLSKLKSILRRASPTEEVYLNSAEDLVWHFKDQAKKARRKSDEEGEIEIFQQSLEYKDIFSHISDRRIYREYIESLCEAHLRRAVNRFRGGRLAAARRDLEKITQLELVTKNLALFDYHYQKAKATLLVVQAAVYLRTGTRRDEAQKNLKEFFHLVESHSHNRLFQKTDYVYRKAKELQNL